MMLVISYFLEILVIVMILFWLYGKKVRINFPVVCIVVTYMLFFITMVAYEVEHTWSLLIYLAIFAFCKLEFKSRLSVVIAYNILMIFFIGVSQIFVATILELLPFNIQKQELFSLLVNILTFLVAYIFYKKIYIHDILANMRFDNFLLKMVLLAIIVVGIIYFIFAKVNTIISATEYLTFFLLAIIIIFFAGTWEKYRIRAKEKETELRTHELYAETYQKLIDAIRARQHEYDNHIHTIINQQYVYDTYQDLVNAQKEYIDMIREETKHTKLLRSGNKTFIAFLYGKILSLEEAGIQCEYKIQIEQLEAEMPVYKMIEIFNNLIVNAQDAVKESPQSERIIKLIAYENDDSIHFEVWNCGEPLSYDYIAKCFKKGVSSKGKDRGFGLYNVKQICVKYSADIIFKNKVIKGRNWIIFIIKIPKSS